jgi:hypothetical protein
MLSEIRDAETGRAVTAMKAFRRSLRDQSAQPGDGFKSIEAAQNRGAE